LARPDGSGGKVIERAAILAAGADSAAVEAWILAHSGKAEHAEHARPSGGLHGRQSDPGSANRAPRRFVLPPGVL
jgi:hypothetical protein